MLGRLFFLRKNYPTAEQFFQKAQIILEQALGEEHPDSLATINHLADAYRKEAKTILAETFYNDVLAVRRRVLGEGHPAVAQTFHGMAQLSCDQSQYTYAEELYKKAL